MQPLKAKGPISFTDGGIITCFNDKQSEKAFASIDETVFGIEISVMEKCWNSPFLIAVKSFGNFNGFKLS